MAPITLAASFINNWWRIRNYSLSSPMLIVVPISRIITRIYKWSHWDSIKSTSTLNTDLICFLFFVPKPASFSVNGLFSSPHTKLFWFSCIFSVTFQSKTLCVRFSYLLSLLAIYWQCQGFLLLQKLICHYQFWPYFDFYQTLCLVSYD